MNPLLTASAITYSTRDRTILDRVDLDATVGELIVIVGPNGAGKSTLLRVLSGYLKPSSGEVQIQGRPLAGIPASELALARAFLGPYPVHEVTFSVRQVVRLGRHPHQVARTSTAADDETIVHQSMLAADVGTVAERPMAELSTGEAQRVGLARLLAQDAPLSLLDEPTSSLDIGHQNLVMQTLADRCWRGATVVAVLHDLNLAARFAARVVLMANGSIVATGSVSEVFRSDLLSETYDYPITVAVNPVTEGPLVVPGR